MTRLLLTQSQVSVVVSSSVVFIFTTLLFLSGYILQQRTVSGLQTAIKPRIPLPPPPPQISVKSPADEPEGLQPSRLYSSRREGGHIAHTDFTAHRRNEVDWTRLAHIQLVHSHHDMCNAIMVLAELHRLKSPARRILLFPHSWAIPTKKAGKGEVGDPFLDSSRRLMKMAARRFGVELRPVYPYIREGQEGVEGKEEELYSLASAFGLFADLDRVMTIETPGLLVDAEPLDAILAFTEPAPFAMLHDPTEGDGVHAEDLFLLQPSKDIHDDLKHLLTNSTTTPPLYSFFPDPLFLSTTTTSASNITLIRSIGTLHHPTPTDLFNGTAFVSNIAYIRFSDPKLPGPQYDIPWSQKVAARPENKDADWVWTKLYGDFAQKRMEVCGLDLEFWRRE